MTRMPDYVLALYDVTNDKHVCRKCVRQNPEYMQRLILGDDSMSECETWNIDLEHGETFACDICARIIKRG